jgi:uncharacterized iron-regulated membrane protein
MKYRELRNLAFYLHRYLGLFVGLILVIVGLTGSLLVFDHEIDTVLVKKRFERIIPQEQTVSLDAIAKTITTNYAAQPDFQISQFDLHFDRDIYQVRLKNNEEQQLEVFVNSYTGAVLGDRNSDSAFFSRVLDLHSSLLAGNIGIIIVGTAAFFLCLLSITGLILWPGWRKLTTGFKIKWNGHSKRTNFDIHKVVGITSLIFLTMTGCTGLIWNFYEHTVPTLYAPIVTSNAPKVTSTTTGKVPLAIAEIVEQAKATIPEAIPSFISVPTKPDQVFTVYMKQPEDAQYFANQVDIDRYSGEVLHVINSQTASFGERIFNSFMPMHSGTFGGLASRILYVFVGLSPSILFTTGLVMYRHRRRKTVTQTTTRELIRP